VYENKYSENVMIKSVSYCAPDRENLYRNTGSCFTMEELKSIASSIDKKVTAKTQQEMVSELKQHFKKCTKFDLCVASQKPVLAKNALKPFKPREWNANPREWLSTVDIKQVMQQYQRAYKRDYTFIGVLPIDFSAKLQSNVCVSPEMCQFMDQIKKNKLKKNQRFGVVFNLDDHTGPGTHWVSLFCDLNQNSPKYGIYYYDSGGIKRLSSIPKTVVELMNMVCQTQDDETFTRNWNRTTQQFQNTECGIFAMLFIILCLEHPDESYDKTVKRIKTDKKDNAINKVRNILYIDHKKIDV
jgi:hypothetical protein